LQDLPNLASDLKSSHEGAPRQVRPLRVKAGRNEPCPCGSGKKFKKCCGK